MINTFKKLFVAEFLNLPKRCFSLNPLKNGNLKKNYLPMNNLSDRNLTNLQLQKWSKVPICI